jgi:lipopolysaccharide export system protein LptA
MRAIALALALVAILVETRGACAQQRQASPLLPGGDAHAPVNVNADRLEYFSKLQKAVYSGHVFARQGDGSLRASTLTIFFDKTQGPGQASGLAGTGGSQVTRMVATGPVTIVQKDEVGVGDSATYEKAQNTVVLVGDVSLTQGPDVVKGDRLIYDLGTGQAQVLGRVSSLFIPGSGGPNSKVAKPAQSERPRAERRRGRAAASEAPRL